jgi:multidrug efflux system membrane fusion protein
MIPFRQLCVVVLSTVVLLGCRQQAQTLPGGAPGEVPVSVAKATQESIPIEVRVVGSVEASSIVEVKSQINGELMEVTFTEGRNVSQGDLLFRIDPRPYQEALRQAEAAVAKDHAQIAQLQATLARDTAQLQYAESDATRLGELQKAGVISRAQYDQSKTGADVARESARATQASIESAKAALDADTAAVATAKLNLSYSEIRAPISGRTGNLLVHKGNLVRANDAALVVINRVSPIFVTFSVPEQHLAAIRRLSALSSLPVRAITQDGTQRSAAGRLAVVDNTVDSSTGAIRLKASFDNKDTLLWPGQFVDVVLTLDTIRNATVVAAEAVQPGQRGQFVYVVKPDRTVESRPVEPGLTFGRRTVIAKGLAPGETVVTDGQLRLYPGAKIRAVDPGKLETGSL